MAITGDVQIKVNTAVLHEKAQSVIKSIKNMEDSFEQLERIINRTLYYWIGEAGELHRSAYKKQKPEIEEIIRRLKEHPRDLMIIAQTYESAETMIRSISSELPGDIIS